MKNWIIIAALVAVLILAGCTAQNTVAENNVIDMSGPDADVSIETTTNEDGNTETEVKIDNDATNDLPPEPATDVWCETGSTFDYSGDGGTVAATIEGMETYKGEEWCKGVQEVETNGITVTTTYYFKYGGEEMWVISDVMGQTTETYISQE